VTYLKLPKELNPDAQPFSNPPPDKLVTTQNIDALILQVASDPDLIMNNSPTHCEMKQESSRFAGLVKKI